MLSLKFNVNDDVLIFLMLDTGKLGLFEEIFKFKTI